MSISSLQVDSELVEKLAYYLWFAEYAYEAGTEPNLKEVLMSRGEAHFAATLTRLCSPQY